MMNDSLRTQISLMPFYMVFFLLTYLSKDHIFFWDTIQLGSAHGHYYYETNFSDLFLPDRFDSGHIPAFGAYLAFCWKLFGKSLPVSHFAMLPFLLGIVWQTFRLIRRFIRPDFVPWAMLLFFADPTLLGQSVLVSPDVALVFFFLLALNSVLSYQRIILIIAVAGLFLTSMRGMMVAFGIVLIDLIWNFKWKQEQRPLHRLVGMSLSYWPAVFISGAYFFLHYQAKGWIAYHPNSPWAPSFERVDFIGFIYNVAIMCWRIIDFGRVFLWIFLVFAVFISWKRLKSDKNVRFIILFALLILLCLSVSFTTYKYLSAHRYLMPFYVLFTLVIAYLLFEIFPFDKFKRILAGLLTLGLLSGNLWIYPEGIAMGWDSTLAHWPYYELRNSMNEFMETENIDYSEVASAFPNVSERKYMELNDIEERHQYLNLDSNHYVLYSNIYNRFNNEQIERLKKEFRLIRKMEKRGIFLHLYQKAGIDQ
jgi:hypothetical protein